MLLLILILILILILPNNTTVPNKCYYGYCAAGYDKTAKRKRCVFTFDLKMSSDLQSLTSNGNVFQSFGAAQVSDLSPRVALDINADCLSKGLSLERLRL